MVRQFRIGLVLIVATLSTVGMIATAGARSLAAQATPPATQPAEVEWIDIGEGLEFYYYFAEGRHADVYLLGEVRNTTADAVPSPYMLVTLLDDQGNIVGETRPIDLYPIVPAGGTTPYQVWVDGVDPGTWATSTLEVISYGQGAGACTSGIELQDVTEVQKSADAFEVSGKIYNGGELPLDGALVYVAVYTLDGVFAGMSNDGIQSTIPPGKSALFSVFGLRPPGLLLHDADLDYTYRVFATTISGGSTYC